MWRARVAHRPPQPHGGHECVDAACRPPPMSDSHRRSARRGTASPPAKMPFSPVIIVGRTPTTRHRRRYLVTVRAARDRCPGRRQESASPHPSLRTQPVGSGKPSSFSRIFSSTRRSLSNRLTVVSQRIVTPSPSASSSSSPWAGNAFAVAAIDDHRIGGTEAACRPGGVDGSVPPAVDDHAAPSIGGSSSATRCRRDRVEHPRGVAGGNVDPAAELGADGEEHASGAALAALAFDVVDRVTEFDATPSAMMRAISASSTDRGSR